MSGQGDFDTSTNRKDFTGPYGARHPIPTVQKYRERRGQRDSSKEEPVEEEGDKNESKVHRAISAIKGIVKDQDLQDGTSENPYGAKNRNADSFDHPSDSGDQQDEDDQDGPPTNDGKGTPDDKKGQGGNQPPDGSLDARQKRKHMKHMTRDTAGREVTDPVTHLPVTIRDSTNKDIKRMPENIPSPGSEVRTSTNLSSGSKSSSQLDKETQEEQEAHDGMEKLFPPPEFETAQEELVRTYHTAVKGALGCSVTISALALFAIQIYNGRNMQSLHGDKEHLPWWRIMIFPSITLALSAGVGLLLISFTSTWLDKKVRGIWQDEVWEAARMEERKEVESSTPESTQWLNSILSAVWPLINPDLFTSLADTLEDVMQASLPKLVRMISVEDLGQGSESIRILGIRWLPTGAAAQTVEADGKLKSSEKSQENSDRAAGGEGQIERDEKKEVDQEHGDTQDDTKDKNEEQDEENIAEGMEAEQGDFLNLELSFAYRARSSGKSLRTKAKNGHLYLAFYLPAGVKLPVWVEMRGFVGTMRMRLQLTPDPPFFSLATITFLGQPKADLSCVPLNKHALNIMDLPVISSFVQSSIDAALAEYVAPKSLTLDLKDMLVGDDFKKDTTARGVVAIMIKRAEEFKEGDGNLGPLKKGSCDPYVTVGWSKFGKPVSSTRVIIEEMRPFWNEMAYVLVGPEELNAEERLKVQLWDSDKTTADDNLGFVEVDLKHLMQNSSTKGKMCDRQDELKGDGEGEKMPGHIDWSLGYFPKTHITPEQFANQSEDSSIRSVDDLKKSVNENAERKLREAKIKDETKELDQQKTQDYKEREDQLIISSPPPDTYPSGILSIQIHQITGLEIESANKNRSKKGDDDSDGEDESDEGLPSSYCTIILNHQRIFKTRTKPKNAKPFFNAGTERFIRDWRTAEIMVAVRDSRVHENDPLLGVVYLPLRHVLGSRSQIVDQFPLAGGIGYGRARISIVFRSIQLQSPDNLLGWDYGTIEFTTPVRSSTLDQSIRSLRLKARTNVGRAKMSPSSESEGTVWKGKHDRNVCVAVRKRYSSCVVFEFRKNKLGPDGTPAFGVLWLRDVPDEEPKKIQIPVYPSKASLKRAETNCDITTDPELAKTQLEVDKIGDLELEVKFWRGLSGYHQGLAKKDANMKDVMECLDVVNDQTGDGGEVHGSSDEDSSDDDENDRDEEAGPPGASKKQRSDKEEQEDGKRGPLAQIKDYKDHSGQLHRQHRGLMQWKAARTVAWVKTKADHGKDHVLDNFRHNERDPGIETEV